MLLTMFGWIMHQCSRDGELAYCQHYCCFQLSFLLPQLHKKDLEAQLFQARLEKQVAVCDTTTRRMELLEEANKQLVEANKVSHLL
jgi:hypothetical protein